jgi:hypothetical protein
MPAVSRGWCQSQAVCDLLSQVAVTRGCIWDPNDTHYLQSRRSNRDLLTHLSPNVQPKPAWAREKTSPPLNPGLPTSQTSIGGTRGAEAGCESLRRRPLPHADEPLMCAVGAVTFTTVRGSRTCDLKSGT